MVGQLALVSKMKCLAFGGCNGEGRLEVVEGSLAFLGPLEFAAYLSQSD